MKYLITVETSDDPGLDAATIGSMIVDTVNTGLSDIQGVNNVSISSITTLPLELV